MNENSNSSIVLAEGVHKTYDAGRVKVAALRNYLKILLGESRVPTRRDLVPMSREGMCPPVAKSP